MIYCKTLEVADYEWLKPQVGHILSVRDMLHESNAVARFEHEHRAWEYAIVTRALLENETRNVLDVGGGASVFAPAWTCLPFSSSVMQIDPGIEMQWIPKQEEVIGQELPFEQVDFFNYTPAKTFGAVISLSTIEHVSEDFRLFHKLLNSATTGCLVAVTFDFHPSGEALVDGHLRTYGTSRIEEMIHMAEDEGFEIYGDGVDYTWRGPDVYEYTFGSLVVRKVRR